MLPKSIQFTAGAGLNFQPVRRRTDPAVQTLLLRNALPGKSLEFSVSGNGAMPREQQGGASAQGGGAMGGQDSGQSPTATPGNQPGGGIGAPINTPDPLSKYKWWILGGLGLLLVVAAAFLLRKPAGAVQGTVTAAPVDYPVHAAAATPAAKNTALLNAIKEEMFALESEKIHGSVSAEEYAQTKAALETVLKRALKSSS